MGLINAVKKAWNVFNRDPTRYQYDTGPGYSFRPDRVRFSRGNERSIVTSVYNRIALDVAALNIRHVMLDNEGRYNLMSQIEYLTNLLYSQLGITQSILDGTADEKTMLNYYNRSIEPIVSAMVDEMKRKFLTKTARSRNHSIQFFRDPFKLVPVADLAEISMTKNEMRQVIGMKPSDDPKADELRNANLSEPAADRSEQVQPKEENQNGKEEV